MAALQIHIKLYHGGQLAGPDCRKFLKNIDLLQEQAERESEFQVVGYINTKRKLNAVVESCFGNELDKVYFEKIQSFKESYITLNGLSITKKSSQPFTTFRKKISLGILSEQGTEAVDHEFKLHLQRFKCFPGHQYAMYLTNCLVSLNSKHM